MIIIIYIEREITYRERYRYRYRCICGCWVPSGDCLFRNGLLLLVSTNPWAPAGESTGPRGVEKKVKRDLKGDPAEEIVVS